MFRMSQLRWIRSLMSLALMITFLAAFNRVMAQISVQEPAREVDSTSTTAQSHDPLEAPYEADYDPNHPDIIELTQQEDQADRELNVVYRTLMNTFLRYDNELGFNELTQAENLRRAQVSWIEYRNKAVDSEIAYCAGGNTQKMAWMIATTDLTRERTARLRKQLIHAMKLGKNPDEVTPEMAALRAWEKRDEERISAWKKNMQALEEAYENRYKEE